MKKARVRDEKKLTQDAHEAQKDIRLLTLMFRDGIPDVADRLEIIKSSTGIPLLNKFFTSLTVLHGLLKELPGK